jgi:hypothetical protein
MEPGMNDIPSGFFCYTIVVARKCIVWAGLIPLCSLSTSVGKTWNFCLVIVVQYFGDNLSGRCPVGSANSRLWIKCFSIRVSFECLVRFGSLNKSALFGAIASYLYHCFIFCLSSPSLPSYFPFFFLLSRFLLFISILSLFWNKKFWEEIIAYFPLTRHGPHRNRNNYGNTQTARWSHNIRYRGNVSTELLPSNDKGIFTKPLPSNDGGDTLSLIRHGPHWKQHVQQFFYCCVCIPYRSNVFTKPLPSNVARVVSRKVSD